MAKKIKTVGRWDNVPTKAEDNSGEVITKPNQSMTIRDILFRNTQGMTYDNYKTPYYEDQATFSSQSLNKIQEMEPTEKLQYLNEVSTQVENLKTKISNHQKEVEAQAAAQAAAVETQNQEITTQE